MSRVVIDTNVVVSALLFGKIPGRLVPMWRSSAIIPYISREILDEYIRVLSYSKFQLNENEIEYLIYRQVLPYFEVVKLPCFRPVIISEDPSDDMFIYCAKTAGASYIISGDRQLLGLKAFEQIRILTPAQFAEHFDKKP
ncbi:MAG: putative toxin-antitoxin system toxin component, PIN family [Desulfosalsimonas sp.]